MNEDTPFEDLLDALNPSPHSVRGYGTDPAFTAVVDFVMRHYGTAASGSQYSATELARLVLSTFRARHPEYGYDDPRHHTFYQLPSVDTLARRLRRQLRRPPLGRPAATPQRLVGDSTVIPLPVRDRAGHIHEKMSITILIDPRTCRVLHCRVRPHHEGPGSPTTTRRR